MSRKLSVFVLTAVFAVIIISPSAADAVEVSAGATVWYAGWNPVFKRFVTTPYSYGIETVTTDAENSTNAAFLAGPVISVSFLNKFSFSTVFAIGEFSGKASYTRSSYSSHYATIQSTYSSRKLDIDSTLNYALFRYIKIFAGIKYQGYKTQIDATDPSLGFAIQSKVKSGGYGTGAGIACAYPIHDNLFALVNVSGVYIKTDNSFNYSYNAGMWGSIDVLYKDTYDVFGGNTTASLAYYFSSYRTTVSLGGRLQYLKYYRAKGEDLYKLDKQSDTFYGIICTIVYAF